MSDFVRESVAAYGAPVRPMTVREYYLAAESGIFEEDEKLELIRGEVVQLSPQKSPHVWAIETLTEEFRAIFPDHVVRPQYPLRLDNLNEPEPDIVVAIGPRSRYKDRHPGADDVVLVVEVADTTLRKDRTLKAELYAEFAISEYWIVDVKAKRLEIYREPAHTEGKSRYRTTEIVERNATVKPLASGDTIDLASVFID